MDERHTPPAGEQPPRDDPQNQGHEPALKRPLQSELVHVLEEAGHVVPEVAGLVKGSMQLGAWPRLLFLAVTCAFTLYTLLTHLRTHGVGLLFLTLGGCLIVSGIIYSMATLKQKEFRRLFFGVPLAICGILLIIPGYSDLQHEMNMKKIPAADKLVGESKSLPPEDAMDNLLKAADMYQQALAALSPGGDPAEREGIKNGLYAALNAMDGVLRYMTEYDAQAGPYFKKAVAAYQTALPVYAPPGDPKKWAELQEILGNMLMYVSDQPDAKDGRTDLLSRAAAAYQAGQSVYDKLKDRTHWQLLQIYRGDVAQAWGLALPGSDRQPRLREAVSLFLDALSVSKETDSNIDMIHVQLGKIYLALAKGEESDARRRDAQEAVHHLQQALLTLSRAGLSKDLYDQRRSFIDPLIAEGRQLLGPAAGH